jgi:hypothetical protein
VNASLMPMIVDPRPNLLLSREQSHVVTRVAA